MSGIHRGLPYDGASTTRATQTTSMLDLEFSAISDTGRVRDHNEDYIGHVLAETPEQARSHGCMFVLADGVGGQDLGEVASKTAVETLTDGFKLSVPGESHTSLLPKLVQAANTRVYETGRSAAPGGVAMATTVVACAIRYDRLSVAHVGDSRCYLIRHGHVSGLTKDHTVANEQLRMGIVTAREASEASTRHLLSRSLGTDLFVNVDVAEHQVHAGDVILLCSDGLHGSVHSADIGPAIQHRSDLDSAARQLVQLALERDGGDNISVQLIHIRNVERVGMYRGRPYKLR